MQGVILLRHCRAWPGDPSVFRRWIPGAGPGV